MEEMSVVSLKEEKKVLGDSSSSGGIWKKTWEKCKSFNHGGSSSISKTTRRRKSSGEEEEEEERLSVVVGGGVSIRKSNSSSNTTPPHASPYMSKSKSLSNIFPTTPAAAAGIKWGRSLSKKLSSSSSSTKVGVSTPKGCLSVYVGPERERFIIKIECTSHPLFKMLLEEAESEYGFHSDGPLLLPCDADMFANLLFQIESDRLDHHIITHSTCSPRARTSYHHLPHSSSTTTFLNNY